MAVHDQCTYEPNTWEDCASSFHLKLGLVEKAPNNFNNPNCRASYKSCVVFLSFLSTYSHNCLYNEVPVHGLVVGTCHSWTYILDSVKLHDEQCTFLKEHQYKQPLYAMTDYVLGTKIWELLLYIYGIFNNGIFINHICNSKTNKTSVSQWMVQRLVLFQSTL